MAPLQALRLADCAGYGLIKNSLIGIASIGHLRQLALLGLQRVRHTHLSAVLAQLPMLQVSCFHVSCGQAQAIMCEPIRRRCVIKKTCMHGVHECFQYMYGALYIVVSHELLAYQSGKRMSLYH